MDLNTLKQQKFYETGLPTANYRFWAYRSVYCLYSYIHQRFIYVHFDSELIKRVQFLISAKYPVWLFHIRLPASDVQNYFSNDNCTEYTLPPNFQKLTAQDYQVTFAKLFEIDCSELNVLREMVGLSAATPNSRDDQLTDDRAWIFFVAHCVKEILRVETVSADILYRILQLDKDKHNLEQQNTLNQQVSQLYKLLFVETDIATVKEKLEGLKYFPTPMGMHFSHCLNFDTLINQ